MGSLDLSLLDGQSSRGLPNGFQSNSRGNVCEPDGLEPIAIIGYSVKFPQNMTSPDSLWKALAERKSAMTEFPKSRLNIDAFYNPDTEILNGFPLRGGHFVDGSIGAFDAPFFSISPLEAADMDPQQRGLLEISYKALENAGIPLEKAACSNTAVFTGSFADDYKAFLHKDPEHQGQYSASGVAPNMLANRISWYFDFRGPSLNLDTACSSSLVALHLGCQGLRDKGFDMALVGGSNLIFNPDMITALNNQNFLSPDSRCFSFDHRANGYARGEGFGMVILKRLSDAVRQNDPIRAVIRATGSNQDGRTPGITQPSKAAQEVLIRDTYRRAGIGLESTRYVEAHGTGTPVGDPIETGAIGAVFGKYRSQSDPLFVGSIKANIGHLEGASGIAGIVKSILILEKGVIPPNAGLERVNPNIKADVWNLKVVLFSISDILDLTDTGHRRGKFPLELTPWPTQGLRRISINSFGFGGTNAHVILDDAYHYLKSNGINGKHCTSPTAGAVENGTNSKQKSATMPDHASNGIPIKGFPGKPIPKLLILSAMDENGLGRLSSVYSHCFSHLDCSQQNDEYLVKLAYTLNERRSLFIWRSFAITGSVSDLQIHGLQLSRPTRMISNASLAYCFTGQGAQWHAMGIELLRFSVFRNSLEDMGTILASLGCPWSLLGELCRDKGSSNVNNPAYSQPLCTAIQVALVDLLRSFHLYPVTVIGHSSGEIAAAYCVKALDRHSAIKVAYYRGLLTARFAINTPGAMLSVGYSEKEIRVYMDKVMCKFGNPGISIGCINSPGNVTITGREDQIDMLKNILDEIGVFARKLLVNVAYHSPHLESIADEYLHLMGSLSSQHLPEIPIIKMVSSVTADTIDPSELCKGQYWVRNLLSPVKFCEALTHVCATYSRAAKEATNYSLQSQVDDLLEIGPHSALQGPIKETLKSLSKIKPIGYSSALIRRVSATESLLGALGSLRCRGHSMNLAAINQQSSASHAQELLTGLPEYPFDHSRSYWRESRLSQGHRFRKQPRDSLLGTPVPDWNPLEARWRRKIRLADSPWLQDHKIHGVILYPAAAMLAMAIEAVKQTFEMKSNRKITGYTIKDAVFQKSLTLLSDPDGVEVEFYLQSLTQTSDTDSSWSHFRLYVHDNQECAECCRGSIRAECDDGPTEVDEGLEARELTESYKRILQEGKISCEKDCDVQSIYAIFDSTGLGFGPAFQTLQNGSYNNNGEAAADISLHKWLSKGEKGYQHPHVVHPTALDGLLQLSFLALSEGGERVIPSLVPTRIRKLWISQTGLSEQSNRTIKAYNKSILKGFREAESTVIALDASLSKVQVVIEGYEKVSLGNKHTGSATSSTLRRLCFNIDHRPDVELLSQESFLEYSDSKFRPLRSPGEFYKDLKTVMSLFLLKTMKALSQSDLESLKPHHQRYLQWMKLEIEKLGVRKDSDSGSEWQKLLQEPQYHHDLCNRLEKTSKTGKFHVQVGNNMLKILLGEVDPLDLFFRTDLVKDYYREFNKTTNGLNSFLIYLDGVAHKYPNMRILEIGAGTGGVTGHVLQTLIGHKECESGVPRFAHYVYTDISPSFFNSAQSMFKGHEDRVTFRTLDIEKDPLYQGFEEGTYDFVIADNVLHATQNLDTSLQNVRKLLKPGGRLVLFELTEPDAMKTNFAFGLLPGWWRANDSYRGLSAGVTEKAWHEILLKNGFSGIEMSLPDYYERECHEHSAIISTALEKNSLQPSHANFPETLIVIDEGCLLQDEVALMLQEGLTKIGWPKPNIIPLEEAALNQKINRMFCIVLVEMEKSVLRNLDQKTFLAIQTILMATMGTLWIARGGGLVQKSPDHAIVNGLFRTARQENSKKKLLTVSFTPGEAKALYFVEKILQICNNTVNVSLNECEPDYVEREGRLCIDRFVDAEYLNHDIASRISNQEHQIKKFGGGCPLVLSIASPGLLDSLEFLEDMDAKRPLKSDEIEIEVQASGVNFRDCLIALGRIPGQSMGFECSGFVRRIGDQCKELKPGDRVCANALGTYQTFARCKAVCAMPLPEHMSFLEGAALPVVFTTAYYALIHVARIRNGESVLIHSAAGGTGQAAIQIAQLFNADIYVTVGSEEKRQLLMNLYKIPRDHIFYSRNESFAQGIKRMTRNGNGVDIALNSLSGDALLNTWQCMAPFGRFLEIGKKDILTNASLPMFPFAQNVSFHAIDLKDAYEHRPWLIQELKDGVVSLLFDGKIQPSQPLHVYGISDIEKSFRYLQSGRNTGKTVVELRQDDLVKTNLQVMPTWSFDKHATYLIAGGLGGIGRSIARWMMRRGAKYLILLSRFGPRTEAAQYLLQELRDQGVHVEAPPCDISNADMLESVLSDLAQRMPSIKGCIQSSMLLKDSIFEQMPYESWTAALEPKVHGSENLHSLLPRGMDFFILLSSIAGAIGATGQANYAAACAYQDALAHYRIGIGEKATTLNLGVMLDDGVLRENEKMRNMMISTGYLMGITQHELYSLLEYHCDPSIEVSSVVKTQVMVGVDVPAALKPRNIDPPSFMQRPPFRLFYNMDSGSAVEKSSDQSNITVNAVKLISAAGSIAEAGSIISDSLMQKLSRALDVPLEHFDSSKAMHTYGVDSLVAVELRNWFAEAFDADVAIFEIMGHASFGDVGLLAARKSKLVDAVLGESPPISTDDGP